MTSVHHYSDQLRFGAVKHYAGTGAMGRLDPGSGETIINKSGDEIIDSDRAGAEIDRAARQMAADRGISYSEAVHRLASDPRAAPMFAIYNRRVRPGEILTAADGPQRVDDPAARAEAGKRLHEMTVSAMQRDTSLSYREAARRVVTSPAAAALARSWIGQTE
jgi:hypothetical protein